ncbi:MAG: hypothetical protein AAFX58_13095 [Pseudomonadota bacterium]
MLLFLHGGPGEPVMGMSTSRTLDSDLINHFVEDYFKRLDAERGKHLVVFEHSAHMVIVEENQKYQDTLISLVHHERNRL